VRAGVFRLVDHFVFGFGIDHQGRNETNIANFVAHRSRRRSR
jgi:hypoxanthine-guanine phosphoribosyltransferase